MLASLKEDYGVDEKRIYATGMSNGGAFTYLLWATRGDLFAAFAPCAASAPQMARRFKPKPVLHVAGEKDSLVKFEWQRQTMDVLRRINQCGDGEPWEPECTLYPSKIGAPVVAFIHPGGHEFPAKAPGLIVKFFKQQAKP
jgi:polyhydroxybutyrate depolymerase